MLRLIGQVSSCKKQTRPVARFASANKFGAGNIPPSAWSSARPVELTPREKEVLNWVASGKRNREIGLILGISTRTAQKHVQSILNKLNVETRCAAAAVWFREKIRAEN